MASFSLQNFVTESSLILNLIQGIYHIACSKKSNSFIISLGISALNSNLLIISSFLRSLFFNNKGQGLERRSLISQKLTLDISFNKFSPLLFLFISSIVLKLLK
ncbi:MAG: hypothetical protein LBQ59_03035 [Candidatus Peribacteria bacterium]|jgi:hypothetical protein|nr:hypothetical protein [Candidatus Peribacteria bacterium]